MQPQCYSRTLGKLCNLLSIVCIVCFTCMQPLLHHRTAAWGGSLAAVLEPLLVNTYCNNYIDFNVNTHYLTLYTEFTVLFIKRLF